MDVSLSVTLKVKGLSESAAEGLMTVLLIFRSPVMMA